MIGRSRRLMVAAFLALAATASRADDGIACGERAPGDQRPRIGLALGGGGARGVAHVSVIKGIEKAGIRVDCVAGTSMGSLVGALYASGMSSAELEELVLSLDWRSMFNDALERAERSYRRKEDDRSNLYTLGVGIGRGGLNITTGVLAGQRILLLFERLTQPVSTIEHFDDLPIPYRAVATDLNTGEAAVIDHGNLALAMRASMSLPGIFDPAKMNGLVLLDGGLVNQVPIDVVRDMGAEIVIAVDVGTPLATLDANASLLAVLGQMTSMMTVGNTRVQLASLTERDVLVVPALGTEVGSADFGKAELALQIGDRAVVAVQDQLDALGAANTTGTAALAAVSAEPAAGPPVIEFLRLDNTTAYDDAVFLTRLDVPLGEPLDADALEFQLQRIFGLETFSLAAYELVEEEGRTGVVVRVRPRSIGPNYLQAGLRLSSDFEGSFGADLRTGVLFAPITKYGAEARVVAQVGSEPGLGGEIYLPFDPRNRNALAARLAFENRDINSFDADGNNIAKYEADSASMVVGWVREFGNIGAASIGVRRATGNASVETGDPALPDFDFDSGEAVATLTLDRLDNLFFPREGYYARFAYVASRDALGADEEFEQADFDLVTATRFGRHSLQGGIRYHTTFDGTAPVQSIYRLGGRTRLVGFRPNELTGQVYGVGFGGYMYELADVLGRGAYLGGTLEYGNAWQDTDDVAFDDGILNGSLYFGFDSWLGPMLLGYGLREGGEGAAFLEIGQTF
jgi:NTE family protein